MEQEKLELKDLVDATVIRGAVEEEKCEAHGTYVVECFDADGKLKWRDTIDNIVTNEGKNYMLDLALANTGTFGAGFLSLISSVGYNPPVVGDTMLSHAGWNEAGNGVNYPVWTTPASNARQPTSWSAASGGSKAITTVSFVIGATGGTVKGCFVVIGSGASATNANTGGKLLSSGPFTLGDKVVATNDTLNVSYSLAL